MLRMKVTELPFFNLLYLVKKTPEVLKRRVLAQQRNPNFTVTLEKLNCSICQLLKPGLISELISLVMFSQLYLSATEKLVYLILFGKINS